ILNCRNGSHIVTVFPWYPQSIERDDLFSNTSHID
ncbi:hypothetical protein CP8484711_0527, partial [Chlamydia psittaci 84-8471/1]